MDDHRKIAISKIADILSGAEILTPSIDLWKTIYNNAGQSKLFEKYSDKLETKVVPYGYGADERYLYQNDYCYTALLETFFSLEDEQEMIRFMNSIVCKIRINRVFPKNIEEKLEEDDYSLTYERYFEIDEFISNLSLEEKNVVLRKYATYSFETFSQNLHLIGLDICLNDIGGLTILPFSDSIRESEFDFSLLMVWLRTNYENIADSYIDAVRAYSSGDNVGCITHCRNIITGIYTTKKDPQRKWMDGLKKICANDKNITNVDANKIHTYVYNANSDDNNLRYQYPRYNLIYRLYAYSCALGAHINEANTTPSGIDFEIVKPEDALMCLRMTEDMLIWLYQGGIC